MALTPPTLRAERQHRGHGADASRSRTAMHSAPSTTARARHATPPPCPMSTARSTGSA